MGFLTSKLIIQRNHDQPESEQRKGIHLEGTQGVNKQTGVGGRKNE